MITQRASVSPSVSAIPSRIAWSSALRLAGLEIVRRRTPSAGSACRSWPGKRAAAYPRRSLSGQASRSLRAAELLEHRQQRAGVLGPGDQRALDPGRSLAGADGLEV